MSLHQRERPPLKMMLLWYALEHVSGHSKEIDRKPMSSYESFRRRLQHSQSSSPTTTTTRKASNYQPPPLVQSLARRRGCITPPSLEPQEYDQEQSPLLKLPKEILLRIYENVIGNNVLHIVRRSNKLGHATCNRASLGNEDDCNYLKCRGSKLPNGVYVKDGKGHDSLIPLLQTCRQIYIDAVEVLYTSNTFEFDCMESLISFSTSILPHRFDSIQNVQLELRFNYSHYFCEGTPSNDYTRWERMWRIIGSMKSLQHLWCRIVWWKPDLTGAEEARYLRELLSVGQLKVFEVNLPALKWNDSKDKEMEGTFEIVRKSQGK